MIIEDRLRVAAPREEVWNYLVDIPKLSACMPGVEDIKQIEPDVYEGRLQVKIGPVSAAFTGVVSLTERRPGRHLTARIEGMDRSTTSSVAANFEADLGHVEDGPVAGTEISYRMEVTMRGRLSQFGMAVFRSTAKKMTAQFAECLEKNLSAGGRVFSQR